MYETKIIKNESFEVISITKQQLIYLIALVWATIKKFLKQQNHSL
jgi:hypothetical protein